MFSEITYEEKMPTWMSGDVQSSPKVTCETGAASSQYGAFMVSLEEQRAEQWGMMLDSRYLLRIFPR